MRSLRDRAGRRAQRLGSDLPRPLKAVAQLSLSAVDPLVRARYRRRTGTREPIPPIALRARTGGVGIKKFLSASAHYVDRALAAAGRPLESFQSVLDFGCGCGRTLVPLARAANPATKIHGTDVDADAIKWLQRHHPELKLGINHFVPPLPYPDGSFDLVYSVSVFTHLDESSQFAWLAELRRVLRSDGLAALTIHGSRAFDQFTRDEMVGAIRSAPQRIASHGSLEEAGFVYESAEPSRWNALRFMDRSGWGLAFHSRDYVRDRWGDFFSSVRILDGPGQEVILAEP
jgi:ubiquinone/menaquinone biosynthesis C-methylase UbiE